MRGGVGAGLVWLALALWSPRQASASSSSPPGLRFASFEVMVPREMSSGPQERSYLLEVEGAGLVVELRPARGFLPRHLPVFTYSEEGERQVDFPFLREDCYYQGALQGRPTSSMAAFCTCSGGFRGFLQVGRKLYEIEPVQDSATFQHVVYRLEDDAGQGRMRCGLTVDESCPEALLPVHLISKTSPGDLWRTRTRYVKVAIVVDHALYVHFGRNDTLVGQRVVEAIHLADSLYKPLRVRVVLVGLEIWSQKNLVAIPKSMSELLGAFNSWRQTTLIRHLRHDVGHLFVYQRFGTTLGTSCVGSVCDPTWASAVEAFITSSMLSFAITFSHQLGHSLGMRHDEKGCFCNRRSCIMAPIQSHTSSFSNCSFDSYFQVINSNSKQCLLVPPEHEKLYELENCGNKVVESGEQCDCGSKLHCESDACCQSNCMLRPGAACAFGKCCANCQFLPAGTVCRGRTNVCDLPEFCTGITEWCPEDTYVQDGAPCYDGAYCYHGKCSTHNEQCKRIFGKQAAVAPLSCFREINIKGDRFGNCGITGNTYRKCENSGVLCGKIQCINVDEIPNLGDNSTIIQTYVNNNLCWGISDLNDTGTVKDGTKCGNSMICVNRDCIKVSLLNYDCNLTKCHNRGVCNSHKNCHCNYGWAPPNCLKEGYGGSIDSGPSPPNSGNTGMIQSLVNAFAAFAVFIAGVGIL
nr:disintegrin and metalloproteinase domain-containing protein 21-like [Anolis sagrei ordinatus]